HSLVHPLLPYTRLFRSYALDPIDEGIIWNYRLSRAVVAACCGSALALCGVILQSLLRNALADPYILGISAGALRSSDCRMTPHRDRKRTRLNSSHVKN